MVEIGPEGVKFEKDDLCNTLSGEILKNQKMLDGLINKGKGAVLGQVKGKMGELLGLGNGALSDDPQDAIDGATDQANTASGAAGDLKDKVLNGELIEGSNASVQTLVECLGGFDLGKIGFPKADSPIDLSELSKLMDKLAGALLDKIVDLIKEALSPLENAISDALERLKDLLPIDLIDELLNIIQCIEDCPNVDKSKLPTLIDVESKLSSIGLKVTGEIDWESNVFKDLGTVTDEMKTQFDKVGEAKDTVMGSVGAVKDVKLPDVPDLPKIPRPPNPLDGISLKDKIESLF